MGQSSKEVLLQGLDILIADGNAYMRRLIRTARASHCPFKGDASYFSIVSGGTTADNAAWSYEKPLPAMAEIAGYLAFYPNRVDKIEEI